MKKPKPRPYRAQIAALPIRQGATGVEVLLITSRETCRWIVPKGWPMKGRRDHQAAAQEAVEEAGVAGRVRKHPIGAYAYEKRLRTRVERLHVMVYLLEVDNELAGWPERNERERRWVRAAEAAKMVQEPALKRIIARLDSELAL